MKVVSTPPAGHALRRSGAVRPTCSRQGDKENRLSGVSPRGYVLLNDPIKSLGTHSVAVRLHPDVEFPVTVEVVAG